MKYEQIRNLPDESFRRLTGVKRQTFEKMVKILFAPFFLAFLLEFRMHLQVQPHTPISLFKRALRPGSAKSECLIKVSSTQRTVLLACQECLIFHRIPPL